MDRKEKSWLPIIEKQEELLVFDKFDQEDVWKFAQKCVELATDKYKKGVAIRVILEGTLVFSYLMKDSNIENNWWMEKKLNVVAKTQVSSLRSSIEYECGVHKKEPWCDELGLSLIHIFSIILRCILTRSKRRDTRKLPRRRRRLGKREIFQRIFYYRMASER